MILRATAFLQSTLFIISLLAAGMASAAEPKILKTGIAMPVSELNRPSKGAKILYRVKNFRWTEYDITVGSGKGLGQKMDIIIKDTEGKTLERSFTMFPGCLLHCNRNSHPITERNYLQIFPIEVGKKVNFRRQRKDGSRKWDHTMTVTGTARIRVQAGEFDAFVIRNAFVGYDDKGKREDNIFSDIAFWSPELGIDVFAKIDDGKGGYGSWELVKYE